MKRHPLRVRVAFVLAALALVAFPLFPAVAGWQSIMPEGQSPPALALDGNDDVLYLSESSGDKVFKVDGRTGAPLWRREFGPTLSNALSVGTDGNDDVLVSGGSFTMAKYDGATGSPLWEHSGVGIGADLVVDGNGDAIAVGTSSGDLAVVKRDGTTGAALWSVMMDGDGDQTGVDFAQRVALDGNGDVLTVGFLDQAGESELAVIRFDGSTGAEEWRSLFPQTNPSQIEMRGIAIDSTGAVVVAGLFDEMFAVFKLDGLTGAEIWRRIIPADVPLTDAARALGMDAADDIVVAGTLDIAAPPALGEERFAVFKLDGSSGAIVWQQILDLGATRDIARDVVVDGAGDATVIGQGTNINVLKFDGSSGAELWRKQIAGRPSVPGRDFGNHLAQRPDGNIIVIGMLRVGRLEDQVVIADIGPTASGETLFVTDVDGDAAARRVVFGSDDIVKPGVGGANDPTVGGAFLEVRNPTTGETDTWPLPAANWSGRGSPPGVRGWVYSDPGHLGGPCNKVRIKERWRKRDAIKASCRGDQIAFSLDEPFQGSLAVSFLAASGERMFCTLFGGDVSRDLPAAGGGTGIFRAKDAPAPASCL